MRSGDGPSRQIPTVDRTSNRRSSVEALCPLDWIRSTKWPRIPDKRSIPLRFVDLFCGCGGLTLGAIEVARVLGRYPHVLLAADSDRQTLSVYERNFSKWLSRASADDILSLLPGDVGSRPTPGERSLSEECEELDLLVAGPPCQGHSDLNNKTRRHDPRNALYLRAVRFAELTRPRAILIENVPTAVHDMENVVDVARSALEACGYTTESFVASAGDVGLAQTRRRHFLVAHQDAPGTVEPLLQTQRRIPSPLRDFVGDLEFEWRQSDDMFAKPSQMMKRNRDRVDYLFSHGLYELPDSERPPCHRDQRHSYKSVYGRLSWGKPAQTLTSGFGSMGQGRYVHPSQRRVITPHEAARIQGFPDFYDFSGVEKRLTLHTMIANAVPPRLAASVILALFSEH